MRLVAIHIVKCYIYKGHRLFNMLITYWLKYLILLVTNTLVFHKLNWKITQTWILNIITPPFSHFQSSKCWEVYLEWRSSLFKEGYTGASWIKRPARARCQTRLWKTLIIPRAYESCNMLTLCLLCVVWWPCWKRCSSSCCQSTASYSSCAYILPNILVYNQSLGLSATNYTCK